jgi:hypothetical protein
MLSMALTLLGCSSDYDINQKEGDPMPGSNDTASDGIGDDTGNGTDDTGPTPGTGINYLEGVCSGFLTDFCAGSNYLDTQNVINYDCQADVEAVNGQVSDSFDAEVDALNAGDERTVLAQYHRVYGSYFGDYETVSLYVMPKDQMAAVEDWGDYSKNDSFQTIAVEMPAGSIRYYAYREIGEASPSERSNWVYVGYQPAGAEPGSFDANWEYGRPNQTANYEGLGNQTDDDLTLWLGHDYFAETDTDEYSQYNGYYVYGTKEGATPEADIEAARSSMSGCTDALIKSAQGILDLSGLDEDGLLEEMNHETDGGESQYYKVGAKTY